jgi:thiamine kinase-like enzyme
MRAVDVPAPPFTDRVEAAQAVVNDRTRSPDLVDTDREFLATRLQTLRHAITGRGGEVQLLHSEPHDGNVLHTTSGLRFIDLETCCYGPVEFDVAHTPAEAARHYAAADRSLVRDCRILALSMVAAWRFDRHDQYPGRHQARTELLGVIRKALDRHHIDVKTRPT